MARALLLLGSVSCPVNLCTSMHIQHLVAVPSSSSHQLLHQEWDSCIEIEQETPSGLNSLPTVEDRLFLRLSHLLDCWCPCCPLHVVEVPSLITHQHWPLPHQKDNWCEIECDCTQCSWLITNCQSLLFLQVPLMLSKSMAFPVVWCTLWKSSVWLTQTNTHSALEM